MSSWSKSILGAIHTSKSLKRIQKRMIMKTELQLHVMRVILHMIEPSSLKSKGCRHCYGGCPVDVKFLEETSKQFGTHSKQLRRI